MALAPPPNGAGVVPPTLPQNPPTFSDITNSKEYVERLSSSKKSQSPDAATDDEIGSAERYHHEIVLTNTLMGADPPQWLVHLIGNINQMRGALDRVDARLENVRIGRENNMALQRNTSVTTYRAKQKEVAGDGTELANTLLTGGVAPLAPLPAAPEIGAPIAQTIDTGNLTHQMILQIIQFYNYNPGIQQGDEVATRSQKIADWLITDRL